MILSAYESWKISKAASDNDQRQWCGNINVTDTEIITFVPNQMHVELQTSWGEASARSSLELWVLKCVLAAAKSFLHLAETKKKTLLSPIVFDCVFILSVISASPSAVAIKIQNLWFKQNINKRHFTSSQFQSPRNYLHTLVQWYTI